MSSVMNEMNDQHFAAQIQESREKAKRSTYLNVRASDNHIRISYGIPTEPNSSRKTTINVRRGEMQYEQVMAAIGEILGQNHDLLQHFSLLDLDCENNGYPQFWSGLAANRVLKEVGFDEVEFPNEPNMTDFLANPALESLEIDSCTFSHGTFESFCQGIQASHITMLRIDADDDAGGVFWPLLWSALEHGASCLESFDFVLTNHSPRGIQTGFESFLANNTTIKSLRLEVFSRGRVGLPFAAALGQGLAINTAVKSLYLGSSPPWGNPTINEQLIQTVFVGRLDRNMAVDSLTVRMEVSPEAANALADGLEQMMRNRGNTATHGGHDQEETLSVLKKLELQVNSLSSKDAATTNAIRALFFDRLYRSDVIRVEKVVFTLPSRTRLVSSKVHDFIGSTRVTNRLLLTGYHHQPNDTLFVDLADVMVANNSILELNVDGVHFHTTTNLLASPNTYRIRCQCRRNEIKVRTLRTNENPSLLPFVLAKLLSLDDTPTDENERQKIEARQLVDRTIAFEMLKDIPALFAVYGKQKRED